MKNWSGNIEYSTLNIAYPSTVEALQQIVKDSNKITALGSQHSFNKIADSREQQISLKEMNKVIALDKTALTIKVEAGMRYGELAPYLHQQGFALHNLASLPHITIAGSCATATHGSGLNNGNLATGIEGIEFVNAAGDLVNLSTKDGEIFNGAAVALGALGIISAITLKLLPTFTMRQFVYQNMPMSALEKNFNSIMAMGYSVSLFTDWKNKNINQVWIKMLAGADDNEPPAELFGATLATTNLHPVTGQSAENCTDQMGVVAPWFEILPHFKMGFKPSAGAELQSEYFIPLEHAFEAMMAMEKISEQIAPYLFTSEIRTIKADELWMSPCYKRTCVAIHTTWYLDEVKVMSLLPLIEKQLAPFNPQPHWGKVFTMEAAGITANIKKLENFKKLASLYDPAGKFKNAFLENLLDK